MSADGHEEHVQAFLTSVLGQEADLADEAALRTLLSEADDRAAKMRLEVARIVQEDRADVDSTLAFAERLQSVLPAMLSREADPYATLQADLQGSLLRRQELEQELHTLDAVTSALHALAEMHSAYVTFTGRMEACELAMAADSLLAMRGHVKALHAHLGGQARAPTVPAPQSAGADQCACCAAGGAAGASGGCAGGRVRGAAPSRGAGGLGRAGARAECGRAGRVGCPAQPAPPQLGARCGTAAAAAGPAQAGRARVQHRAGASCQGCGCRGRSREWEWEWEWE